MLVGLLVTFGVFLYLWKHGEKAVLAWTLLLGLIYGTGILFVVYELAHLSPDLTYGSDARYYWEAADAVLTREAHWSEFAAPLYVLWASTVVALSPGMSFVWLIFANLAVLMATFALQAVFLKRALLEIGVSKRTISVAVSVLALLYVNGIVIWTVARGLKEVLVWFFLALSAFSASPLIRVLSAISLLYLRPLGAFLVLVALFSRRLSGLAANGGFGVFLLVLGVAIPIAYQVFQYIGLLTLFRESIGEGTGLESVSNQGLFTVPILGAYVSVFRFLLGPGPVRALEQLFYGDVFEVSTRVGDWLIFWGATQWWITLGLLFACFLREEKRRTFLRVMRSMGVWFWLSVTIVIVYAFIYFGTGDTRHRATVYVLSAPLLATIFTVRLGFGSKSIVKSRGKALVEGESED